MRLGCLRRLLGVLLALPGGRGRAAAIGRLVCGRRPCRARRQRPRRPDAPAPEPSAGQGAPAATHSAAARAQDPPKRSAEAPLPEVWQPARDRSRASALRARSSRRSMPSSCRSRRSARASAGQPPPFASSASAASTRVTFSPPALVNCDLAAALDHMDQATTCSRSPEASGRADRQGRGDERLLVPRRLPAAAATGSASTPSPTRSTSAAS